MLDLEFQNRVEGNSKYTENEVLKDYLNSKRNNNPSSALSVIEKNLSTYFASADYPYNEMQSYLDMNNSIP